MTDSAGTASRRLAIEALQRIDEDGAYANLLLPKMLDDSELSAADRGFVTELVYGTTRMRRAVDYLVDRFLTRDDIEPRVRAALRLGAYQLEFLGTPPHAAVDATVAATPKRARGLVNAILRKVAGASTEWPNDAIRLSYPDWILERLSADLGDRALPVLEAMNRPAEVHVRPDGYRQDLSSQEVARLIDADSGSLVVDLCAAPGGKATYIAGCGATVVGLDIHEHRARLVQTAARDTSTSVLTVQADGTSSPLRQASADAVLVDAPCSGLGSLRRRPDARWRIEPGDVAALSELQFNLIRSATELVRPGGQLVFSVCTLTAAESLDVDRCVASDLPEFVPEPLPELWETYGRGGRLLPDAFAGDGMAAFSYRRSQ